MCERCVRICNAIGELTCGEGDAVNILSENQEGYGPNNRAVDCCASWTDWKDMRFYAHDLVEALELAVKAKRAST